MPHSTSRAISAVSADANADRSDTPSAAVRIGNTTNTRFAATARSGRRTALFLAVGALSACGGGEAGRAPAPTLSVAVDTIGDTIVVRTAGDVPASEELVLRERWRVGDPDGDETTSFGRVHSIAVNAEDELFVFEASVPQLRHYAADGTLLGVLGGKGSGPGEYSRANGLAVLTDGRVVLWDSGNSRVNLYAANGEFLTQWIPPVQQFNTGRNTVFAMVDGGVALQAFLRDSALTREALGRVAWFLFDGNGSVRDTVRAPDFDDAPPNLIAQREGSVSTRPVPFIADGQAALDRHGALVVSPGSPYLLRYEHEGQHRRVEREVRAHPVSDDEREQTRASVGWQMARTEPGWSWNGPDIPTTKPPVLALATTLDDQLLVSVSAESEPFEPEPARIVAGEEPRPVVAFRAPTTYELFAPDGSFRGRFRLPFGAQLHALRGNDAWGTVVDELDVPYLVRWTLEQPSAARD